jgi:hypothetical protein
MLESIGPVTDDDVRAVGEGFERVTPNVNSVASEFIVDIPVQYLSEFAYASPPDCVFAGSPS